MPEDSPVNHEPARCTVTSDDFDVPQHILESLKIESWSCSRPVRSSESTDSKRCIWHTDTTEKPADELAEVINDGDLHGAIIPPSTDFTSLSFPPKSGFVNADLSEADLIGADFSGADLAYADLSEAYLDYADFSEAYLDHADLSGADLIEADLSEAHLRSSDLSGADLAYADLSEAYLPYADLSEANFSEAGLSKAHLHYTDLSEADFSEADLSEADFRNADLSQLKLNQSTQVGGLCRRPGSSAGWDGLAQSYHDLKAEFSDQGLDQKARQARYLERRARAKEAWANRDIRASAGSILSRTLTGYGTRVSHVLAWTVALLILPTLWYGLTPPEYWDNSAIYYSVVTFVTSPPHPPHTDGSTIGAVTRAIVLFQTYFGTALIILFGYVLSNRDRI